MTMKKKTFFFKYFLIDKKLYLTQIYKYCIERFKKFEVFISKYIEEDKFLVK